MGSADFECDRLLGFVWVRFASVNLELAELGAAEAGLRDHSPNSALNHQNRTAVTKLLGRFHDLATNVTRETGVDLIGLLGTGEHDLIGVDHDNEVAGVNVSGESRLLFAAKKAGRFYGNLAKYFALGIDHIPFAFDLVWLGGKCLHYDYRESLRHSCGSASIRRARKLGSQLRAVNREIFRKIRVFAFLEIKLLHIM